MGHVTMDHLAIVKINSNLVKTFYFNPTYDGRTTFSVNISGVRE